jgi:hypothetical protein
MSLGGFLYQASWRNVADAETRRRAREATYAQWLTVDSLTDEIRNRLARLKPAEEVEIPSIAATIRREHGVDADKLRQQLRNRGT